ncbi:pilus assembly protein PilM, partial [Candidatus Berkelbacteria bacterium]|nr:pilus assembly protein PilM [Candidatus Berkelbacteria bacterium]
MFARHLTTVLDSAHGGAIRSRRVIVAIPEEKVFIQIVTIPKVDSDKIADVIRWQSEKLISFAIDSVSMDFTVIEEKKTTMEVCITASPKDVVDSIIVAL